MKHQSGVSWAKTICVSLCTSSSKRQHQWLRIWHHSLCWFWVTENFSLTLPSNSNTSVLQRDHMERMGLNGWNTLWKNGLYSFCYRHYSLWKQGMGNQSFQKNHPFFLWGTCQHMFQWELLNLKQKFYMRIDPKIYGNSDIALWSRCLFVDRTTAFFYYLAAGKISLVPVNL